MNDKLNDIREFRNTYKVPSVQVSILEDNDQVINLTTGYYNLEEKREADDQTIYNIGSITKSFVACGTDNH